MATDIVGSYLGAQTGLTNSSGQTTTDLLVSSYKQTRQAEVDAATKRKTDLETQKNFYNTLRGNLTALSDEINKFTASDSSSKFITRSITSSDPATVSVSVDSTAESGINTIKVNRLASNDILISKQLAISSSDKFSITGESTFKVNGKDVKVTIDPDSTNEQAMKTIASAINKVTDINVTASYLKDTETTGRLTMTSKNTGASNKITFSDNGSGILNALGLDNVDSGATNRSQTVTDPTLAYYKNSDINNINSSAEVNGINISRGTNSITDILPGVTINLLKPQLSTDSAITLTTDVNEGAVENVVNPLLNAYNDTIKYLNKNNSLKRNDSAVSSLFNNLRSISSQPVTSAGDGNPQFLSDMGIKTNTDGTLMITDMTKLTDLLKDNPAKVSNLFTGTDGLANKLNNIISKLVGSDGSINSRTYSLGTQVDAANKRITNLQNSIDKQAEILKKQYTSVYSLYITATQQFSYLTSGSSTSTTSTS